MATAERAIHSQSGRRWAALLIACWVLSLVVSLPAAPVAARDRIGYATKRLTIWAERSTNSRELGTVRRDTEIIVTGRARKGFYPVRVDGVEGWALTGSVAIDIGGDATLGAGAKSRRAGAGGSTLAGFTTETVNLRSGPGTNNRVESVIPAGRQLQLTGEERAGFVGVRIGNSAGWVAKEYVDSERPLSGSGELSGRGELSGGGELKPVLKGNPRHMTPEDIVPFIYAAADYYGQPREDMLRVARCESDLVPMAVNAEGGSYGIFQFKPGTWLSTPYAEYDIFDPRASAYAAAWMWSVGRRNEWVCQ